MDPVEPWIDGNAVRQLAARLLASPDSSEIVDSPDAGFGPGFEGFTSGEAPSKPTPPPTASAGTSPSPAPGPVQTPEPMRQDPVPEALEPVPELRVQAQAPPQPPVEPRSRETESKSFLTSTTSEETGTQPSEGEAEPAFRRREEPAAAQHQETNRGPLMERMLRFRDWLCRHAEARSVFILDREGQAVLDDPAYAKLHFLARSLSNAYRPVPGQPGNVHVKVGAEAYLVVIPVETAFGCLVLGTVLPRPLNAPSVEIVAKALAEAAQPRKG